MLDFPASPTTGQIYNGTNGVTYRWSGTIWVATGASAGGDFCAALVIGAPPLTVTFATMLLPVITGNSGGWYNVTNGRYTPPAGRYLIAVSASATTSAGSAWLGIQIRKNGTVVQDNYDNCGTPSWYATTSLTLILDANGSDWFDFQAGMSSGTSSTDSLNFAAFPISGIKGPQGDPPTAGTLTAQSIMLYNSTSNQAIATGTPADFNWDVVGYNSTGGTFTTPSFTVPTGMGGTWNADLTIQYVNSTATYTLLNLLVNGAVVGSQVGIVNGNGVNTVLVGKFRLAVGDTVKVQAAGGLASTTFIGTTSGQRRSWLHLMRVGA